MKRLIRRPLRMLWRWTAPVRRPLARKAEAFLARAYAQAPIPAPQVHLTCHCRVTEETSLVMDYMVRELVRLRSQVERLQEAVDDLSPASTGLSVVNGLDADEPAARSAG